MSNRKQTRAGGAWGLYALLIIWEVLGWIPSIEKKKKT